ncbi:MAG: hypothetical protein A3F77_17745 [Betaproteobacteria bacterium RIFCSPLOWO2_12_FULL_67_28]|nr:MAG: hypothetical protein A3F77_17745 [Betaproteobacteria bacterium RIFCSPLOWO2_12_FULL_67_28]
MSTVTLLLFLGLAVATDLAASRVPNWLTLSAALAGVGFSLTAGGIGFGQALGGGAMGLAVFIPLYAFRAIGAGDVKLMIAAGTYLGMAGSLAAAVYALVLGGVVALGYAWNKGAAGQLWRNLRLFFYSSAAYLADRSLPRADDMPLSKLRAPYAIAIAAGVALHLLTRHDFGAAMP